MDVYALQSLTCWPLFSIYSVYYMIQIMNGKGEPLQPAFDAWKEDVSKNHDGTIYFNKYRPERDN